MTTQNNISASSDLLLTREEIAEVLKVSSDTVGKMLREGRLPGQKIGREWRCYQSTLTAFLKQGETNHHGKPNS